MRSVFQRPPRRKRPPIEPSRWPWPVQWSPEVRHQQVPRQLRGIRWSGEPPGLLPAGVNLGEPRRSLDETVTPESLIDETSKLRR